MRKPVSLLVTVLLAATACLVLPNSASATAAPGSAPAVASEPPLSLTGGNKKVVYKIYGDHLVAADLGVGVKALGEDFQIWSNRATYDSQITSQWRRASGTVDLPVGTMKTLDSLPGFFQLTFKNAAGEVVKQRAFPFCPSEARRTSPNGPVTNRYPQVCYFNPYALGSVMGVPQGWVTNGTAWTPKFQLRDGKYEVTARIAPKYVNLFGLEPGVTKTFSVSVIHPEMGGDSSEAFARQLGPSPSAPLQPAPRPTTAQAGARTDLPDLRSLPPFDISLNADGTQIQFGANTWNAGNRPLVIDGFRDNVNQEEMTAYQFFLDAQGNQTGFQKVGKISWHAENHQHWHFQDFARYRLLKPDLTQAVRSRKNSWCLAPTDAIDFTVDGADWNPGNGDLNTACGGRRALSIREVLESGSGDTYYQSMAGQSFNITRVPDGVYFISVEANPNGNLIESDTSNNNATRRITLGHNAAGKRTLKVAPVGIVIEDPSFF